jgi:hypothetical protein
MACNIANRRGDKQSKETNMPRRTLVLLCALAALFFAARPAAAKPRIVHVIVALADNQSQGLVPVPAKIGNGDDPANNLYWGCDEGLKSVFGHAAEWTPTATLNAPAPAILERLVFYNAQADAWLVADAYRGRAMRQALVDLFAAAAGHQPSSLKVALNGKTREIPLGGGADLLAFIGHNGLMDEEMTPPPKSAGASGPAVIVLACLSERYFLKPLRDCGARPLLLTTQLMYPGAFILQSAAAGWLAGEGPDAIRERAAQAYARNQKIGLNAARGVFSAPGS